MLNYCVVLHGNSVSHYRAFPRARCNTIQHTSTQAHTYTCNTNVYKNSSGHSIGLDYSDGLMFKVTYTIIGNRDCIRNAGFSKSPKIALQNALRSAWDSYERSHNTNWADCWVRIYNPYGKEIFSGFESDLR